MALEFKYDYVNLDQSDTLERLVERRLATLERQVKSRGDKPTRVNVKFVVDSRSPFGNLKGSHVVLNVKLQGIPKLLVSIKKDADLRKAVAKASDTLIKEVQRYSKKQLHMRQKPQRDQRQG